jgi:hypothetical protein
MDTTPCPHNRIRIMWNDELWYVDCRAQTVIVDEAYGWEYFWSHDQPSTCLDCVRYVSIALVADARRIVARHKQQRRTVERPHD